MVLGKPGRVITVGNWQKLNEKENIDLVKDKIRLEISKGLEKEKIFSDKDKKLLLELYKKLKKEFEDIETN